MDQRQRWWGCAWTQDGQPMCTVRALVLNSGFNIGCSCDTKIDMREKGQVLRQSITCLNSGFNFDKGVVISKGTFSLVPFSKKWTKLVQFNFLLYVEIKG
jgi:hypothetical protein